MPSVLLEILAQIYYIPGIKRVNQEIKKNYKSNIVNMIFFKNFDEFSCADYITEMNGLELP